MALAIGVLGPLVIEINGRKLGSVPRKARALLAYLAAQGGRPVSRERLADILWPYVGSEQARHNLSSCLTRLREALDGDASGHLITRFAECQLEGVDTDIDQFDRLSSSSKRSDLEAAAKLYRGELLTDFVIDAEPFQEWLASERERRLDQICEVLQRLVALQDLSGELSEAIQSARRLVALDPLSEIAQRALIRVYARAGRRPEALRQYRTLVEILKRELGVAPAAETQALANEISHGNGIFPPREAEEASLERTAELTLKSLPAQTSAPVTVFWSGEQLKRVDFHPAHLSSAGADGRLSNYQHLRDEAERLLIILKSNNAAYRVVDTLKAYNDLVGYDLTTLDIFRLGHMGIRLSATILGSKGILSDENYSELNGLPLTIEPQLV